MLNATKNMPQPPQEAQEKFIYSQVIMMTLAATLQRNKMYSSEASETDKIDIRKAIESELSNMMKKYLKEVTEEEHLQNIVHLSKYISKEHGDRLEGKRFRIGTAQKALNLFLKYLWCLKKIHEPPHFSIDAIMLTKHLGCPDIRWTLLDFIDCYKNIIKKTELKAKEEGYTLATWELCKYNTSIQDG